MGAKWLRLGGSRYELGAETITNSVKLVVLRIIGNSITEFAREGLKGVVEIPVRDFESENALTASAVA